MPKHKSKETVSSGSESDEAPTTKKQKQQKPKKKASDDNDQSEMIALSRQRFVDVRDFRGKTLIDIREYYEFDGELKPGKKGISLTVDQWRKLVDQVADIDQKIKDMK